MTHQHEAVLTTESNNDPGTPNRKQVYPHYHTFTFPGYSHEYLWHFPAATVNTQRTLAGQILGATSALFLHSLSLLCFARPIRPAYVGAPERGGCETLAQFWALHLKGRRRGRISNNQQTTEQTYITIRPIRPLVPNTCGYKAVERQLL